MSLQERIDALTSPARVLEGLPVDRAMLGIALRLGTEGGKRFRPWLFSAVHQQLAGLPGPRDADRPAPPDPRVLDQVAASLELLHSAFVIHDDVIDNDEVRRGRESVPGWFAASSPSASATYARAGGILTGDLALAAAVRGLATCGAPSHVTASLLDLLDAMLQDSAVGELADVRLADGGPRVPSVEEALAVAEHKTAGYSFVLPMQAAAIVAEADATVVDQVGEVGRALGIAFQLRDDLCGMFSDAGATGKDPLGDLREGKRTPLVAHAAHTSEWWRVERHLGDPTAGPDQLEEVRRALVEAGSVAYVEQLVARLVRRARLHARPLGLEPVVVDPLTSTWTMPTAAPAHVVEGVA